MEFSPVWHPPHSVLPCLQNCLRVSPLQTTLQQLFQILSSLFSNLPHLLLSSPLHSSLCAPAYLCVRVCVCVLVCVCVCVWCAKNVMFLYYLFRLMCIFEGLTDFVKRCVLTLVDEMACYRNDQYYDYCCCLGGVGCHPHWVDSVLDLHNTIGLQAKQVTVLVQAVVCIQCPSVCSDTIVTVSTLAFSRPFIQLT